MRDDLKDYCLWLPNGEAARDRFWAVSGVLHYSLFVWIDIPEAVA